MTVGAGLLASALVWIGLESLVARPEPPRAWSWSRVPLVVTGVVLLLIQVAAVIEHNRGDRPGAPLAFVLIAVGVALRVTAIRTLREDFVSATVVPARLCQHGVYRWMWHPSEIGLMIAATGTAAAAGSLIAAALTGLVLVPLSLARTRAEDRLLASLRRTGAVPVRS